MRWTISIAKTDSERREIYAFRYKIYVEEMGRLQRYADHKAKVIFDPLDSNGYNIIARNHDGLLSGCVRVNFSRDGGLEYYSSLLNMSSVGDDHPSRTAVCTRFMIEPSSRKTDLAIQLCRACFELGLNNEIKWNFIDCNDHLVGFFGKMGYDYIAPVEHEEYGLVNAMRFDLSDPRHRATNSIFASLCLIKQDI